MGYHLTIGEAKITTDKDYGTVQVKATTLRNDNAPAYDEPTDYISERWPSYTNWSDAMEFIGLYDLMFDKESDPKCLIYEHPGCVLLLPYHKELIDKAYAEFYIKYPNCKPGYNKLDPSWPKENNYATRLEWVKYWVDYALENCEIPVFYNC